MSEVQTGQNVEVHYVGTFDDGTVFDSSRNRGETLSFEVGSGQTIAGFEQGVLGMSVGETKNITIEPEDGYGPTNPDAFRSYPTDAFPGDVTLTEGVTIVGKNEMGQDVLAKVHKIDDNEIHLDFNHPMAGKRLNFEVEIISVS